jgi:hypothetical protein
MIRRSTALGAACFILIAGCGFVQEGHVAAGWATIAFSAFVVIRVIRNACRRGIII